MVPIFSIPFCRAFDTAECLRHENSNKVTKRDEKVVLNVYVLSLPCYVSMLS